MSVSLYQSERVHCTYCTCYILWRDPPNPRAKTVFDCPVDAFYDIDQVCDF